MLVANSFLRALRTCCSMVARQRLTMSRVRRSVEHVRLSDAPTTFGDVAIDFGAAGLYLVGLQVSLATLAASGVAVACCSLLPSGPVSAVRTLALCSAIDLSAVAGIIFERRWPSRPSLTRPKWPPIASGVLDRLSSSSCNSPPRTADCRGRLRPPREETERELYYFA